MPRKGNGERNRRTMVLAAQVKAANADFGADAVIGQRKSRPVIDKPRRVDLATPRHLGLAVFTPSIVVGGTSRGQWLEQRAATAPKPPTKAIQPPTYVQVVRGQVRSAERAVRQFNQAMTAKRQLLADEIAFTDAIIKALFVMITRNFGDDLDGFRRGLVELDLRELAFAEWRMRIESEIAAGDASLERVIPEVERRREHLRAVLAKISGPKTADDCLLWETTPTAELQARAKAKKAAVKAAAPVKTGTITPITEDHPRSHLDPKFFTRGTD